MTQAADRTPFYFPTFREERKNTINHGGGPKVQMSIKPEGETFDDLVDVTYPHNAHEILWRKKENVDR